MSAEEQGPREPTEEELRQALEEQIRRLRPSDVMVQTVVTLLTLAARRLGLEGEEQRTDLPQAKEAIDGARALMPLLPEDVSSQLAEPLSALQLEYAKVTGQQAPSGKQQATTEGSDPPPDDVRSRIWTPGS